MKISRLAVSILAGFAAGCATEIPLRAPALTLNELPDCYAANYDAQLDLFTIRNAGALPVNQQCLLVVGGAAARLKPGRYAIHVSDGGGGGAGGTWQLGLGRSNGGAGGGGAGAREVINRVILTEGAYKLTIGGGGPGGNACVFAPFYIPGSPGYLGSPSNMLRVSSGEVIAGVIGADSYARPTRAQNEKLAGRMDGHGGSGPGQTAGGHGGAFNPATGAVYLAEAGQGRRATPAGTTAESTERWMAGGGVGPTVAGNASVAGTLSGFAPTATLSPVEAKATDPVVSGGGGGATSRAPGGSGGGESPGTRNQPPQRGKLGSGGGGGEGSAIECDAGAPGGHGFIAVRPG